MEKKGRVDNTSFTESSRQTVFFLRETYGISEKCKLFFQRAMVDWYGRNQRSYAWRTSNDPYKIIVAEIMLQQTNADRVAQIYPQFMQRFPDAIALGRSEVEELKLILKPLGLDYRAARLKNMAQRLATEFGGEFPSAEETLLALPGVGQYVANAVLCFAYDRRTALVDVNVIRVYDRVFGLNSEKNRPREDTRLWEFAERMLPETNFREYNLAVLDFSAAICTARNPQCTECPLNGICFHYAKGTQTDGK